MGKPLNLLILAEAPSHQCYRCMSPAARRVGTSWMCTMHWRFFQMRTQAKRTGQLAPTLEQLEAMPTDVCPDCGKRMNWLTKEGSASVATLQHYRDGTFGIVCKTCNTRHAFMPGDSYRAMPKDLKWCRRCEQAKPLADFPGTYCRSCGGRLRA
jgi:hypothetical protein